MYIRFFWWDFSLDVFLQTHKMKRPEATLVLRSSGPLLNVAVDDQGTVCDIRNSLRNTGVQQCLFTGIYAVETSLLQHMEAGKVESIITVFLNRIRSSPGSIAGIVIDDSNWYDIGSLEAYETLKTRIAASED